MCQKNATIFDNSSEVCYAGSSSIFSAFTIYSQCSLDLGKSERPLPGHAHVRARVHGDPSSHLRSKRPCRRYGTEVEVVDYWFARLHLLELVALRDHPSALPEVRSHHPRSIFALFHRRACSAGPGLMPLPTTPFPYPHIESEERVVAGDGPGAVAGAALRGGLPNREQRRRHRHHGLRTRTRALVRARALARVMRAARRGPFAA